MAKKAANVTNWNLETELVVVGSGAAGMTAALTAKLEGLDTLLLEKSKHYGGSTSISDGCFWIPNNHLMAEAGIKDSKDNARTYMKNTVGGRTPIENQEAFLTHAPEMIRYLAKLPHMKFRIAHDFPDYYPERPGAMSEGRGIDTPVFNGKKLGKLFKQLHPHPIKVPFDFVFTVDEVRKVTLARAHIPFIVDAFKVLVRNVYNKVACTRHVGSGGALIARLRLSLHEHNVPVRLNAAVKDLIFENGSVIGVEVERKRPYIHVLANLIPTH